MPRHHGIGSFIILVLIICIVISIAGVNSFAATGQSILFIEDGSSPLYSINNNLSNLRDDLISEGYQVDRTVISSVSSNDLDGYDIVVFATAWSWNESGPGIPITPDQVDVFKNFVYNGGGLYLIGENIYLPAWNAAVNIIGEPFGLQIVPSSKTADIDDLVVHAITQNISSFHIQNGSYLTVSGQAQAIASLPTGEPMLAVSEYGAGRVVMMADINFRSNLYFNVLDNHQLEMNIFSWLAMGSGHPSISDEEKSASAGNHELITLLTNPMDTSGIRTMDLNYYLNDPVIWDPDVKYITVWLETEVFDLMAAQQKTMLPTGLTLLKDYNIRLMMKIVYKDGTVETKEVDNADIARNIPVLIPVDEFADASDLGIVYIDGEGNTAELPVTPVMVDGMNYLKFENNHFSEYGMVCGIAMDMAEKMAQQSYIILPGDTLASIATKFGVTVQNLAAANNIGNPNMIYAGKVIVIA